MILTQWILRLLGRDTTPVPDARDVICARLDLDIRQERTTTMSTLPPFTVRRVYDHWEVTGPDGFITDVSDDAVAGSRHPSFAARDIGILRYAADYRVPSAQTDQEIDDRRRADAYRAQDLGRFPC